jgi:hypothetical protein
MSDRVADELHLCYLVTPIGNLLDPPDWMGYRTRTHHRTRTR